MSSAAEVRAVVAGLRMTFATKIREYGDYRPDEARLVVESAAVLHKRLAKILELEEWKQEDLLEMSAVSFLLAVGMKNDSMEEESP